MLRRTAVLALTAALALGVSACGAEKHSDADRAPAASEALYTDAGGLTYQVQLSRQLNPRDPEDADYFRPLTPEQASTQKGQVWFGVFLRVENQTKQALPSAREFTVQDTQHNVFRPMPAGQNAFAYRPEVIPPKGFLPNPERLQAYAGTQGALLLFKLPLGSLNNRPLELAIKNPSDTRRAARIDLDV